MLSTSEPVAAIGRSCQKEVGVCSSVVGLSAAGGSRALDLLTLVALMTRKIENGSGNYSTRLLKFTSCRSGQATKDKMRALQPRHSCIYF